MKKIGITYSTKLLKAIKDGELENTAILQNALDLVSCVMVTAAMGGQPQGRYLRAVIRNRWLPPDEFCRSVMRQAYREASRTQVFFQAGLENMCIGVEITFERAGQNSPAALILEGAAEHSGINMFRPKSIGVNVPAIVMETYGEHGEPCIRIFDSSLTENDRKFTTHSAMRYEPGEITLIADVPATSITRMVEGHKDRSFGHIQRTASMKVRRRVLYSHALEEAKKIAEAAQLPVDDRVGDLIRC